MSNYWILQANPAKYFIVDYFLDNYLKSDPEYEDWWQTDDYDLERSDIVYIWKCRSEPRAVAAPEWHQWMRLTNRERWVRGIYAIGQVTQPSGIKTFKREDTERFKKYHIGDTWYEPAERRDSKVCFKYIRNLVDNPLILDNTIWQERLPRVYDGFIRAGAGQGKSVFPLRHEEGRVVSELIQGRRA